MLFDRSAVNKRQFNPSMHRGFIYPSLAKDCFTSGFSPGVSGSKFNGVLTPWMYFWNYWVKTRFYWCLLPRLESRGKAWYQTCQLDQPEA